MAGVSWTSNFGTNKILESRLGFTRFAQLLGIQNKIDPKSLGVDTGPLSPADFGVPYVYLLPLGYGGYIGGVQGYPITTRPDQTWDWSEHFSWVKGNHTIKFGGNFQRAYTNSLRNNARTGLLLGYFSYYASMSGDPIQDSIEELLLGKADNANRAFGDTHRHLVQNSVGFYAQDDWKIKPRLTLTFGLRYDIFGNLRDRDNVAANFFPGRGPGAGRTRNRPSIRHRLQRLRASRRLCLGHFRDRQDGFARRLLAGLRRPEFRHPRVAVFSGGSERGRVYSTQPGTVFGFDLLGCRPGKRLR